PRCQGLSRGTTRFGTDAVIYPYMDSSRSASRKLMSDSEPHAYIRPLVGERPPGPDVLRSLSPQRPHGICVPRIQPGRPRDGLTNLLISQVSCLHRNSLEIQNTPPTYAMAYCVCIVRHARCASRLPCLSCGAPGWGLLL